MEGYRGAGEGRCVGPWRRGLAGVADVVAEEVDVEAGGVAGSSLRRAAVRRRVAPRELLRLRWWKATVTWMRPWRNVFSGCGA